MSKPTRTVTFPNGYTTAHTYQSMSFEEVIRDAVTSDGAAMMTSKTIWDVARELTYLDVHSRDNDWSDVA